MFTGCWATWLPADLRLCAPCDAFGLAKGVLACGHTHTCTAHASLFPSHAFFPMLVARFTWSGLTSALLYSVCGHLPMPHPIHLLCVSCLLPWCESHGAHPWNLWPPAGIQLKGLKCGVSHHVPSGCQPLFSVLLQRRRSPSFLHSPNSCPFTHYFALTASILSFSQLMGLQTTAGRPNSAHHLGLGARNRSLHFTP